MRLNVTLRSLLAIAALALCACYVCNAQADEPQKAKNVILFIGDGMGFNSDHLGAYYRFGELNSQVYQKFPVVLGSATFNVHKHQNGVAEWNPDTDFGYVPEEFWKGPKGGTWRHTNTDVTDSASSATALNTGQKTVTQRLNYDCNEKPIENFADKNYKAGRSVGIATTAQISHATPAGASAHNMGRNNYAEIGSEQINDLPITVLMGGGHPEYSNGVKIDKPADELNYQFVGGRETWEHVKNDENYKGWTFIDERSKFQELANATPDKNVELPKRVLGIVRTTGDVEPIDGDLDDPDYLLKFFSKETIEAEPSLAEMTLGCLNILSTNPNGFYLMVEGSNIDHANHARNAAKCCLEQVSFAKAIEAACDWVEKYSSWDETIMIVTADHETGQMWGDGTYDDDNDNGKYDKEDTFNGFKQIPKSPRGQVPAVQYLSSSHTNALVPVYVKGCNADCAYDFIKGNDKKAGEFWGFSGDYIYNSDIFNIMSTASGIK